MSCKTLFFSPMYYWLLQIQISTWILRNSTKNLWWKVKSSTNLSWIATGSLLIQCTQKSQTRPPKSKMLIKLPNYHIHCVLFCFCLKSSPRKALDCVYKYRFLRECSVNKCYQHVHFWRCVVLRGCQQRSHPASWWLWERIHLPVQETRVPSLGPEDPLEKEMATHSSILAWRILWTEQPGGL